jgi:hypothetical protein
MSLLILIPQYLANLERSTLSGGEITLFTYVAYVTLGMKIAGPWHFTRTVTRSMSPAFSTTGLFMVHPKRHLKLPQYTYKIEVGRMFKKPRDFTRLTLKLFRKKL